jgi:very-short-patch-repair endonuclease
MNIIQQRAKELRKNTTQEEKTLWRYIKNNQLGVKFRRQIPIDNYIVDFISHEKKLIIEIDGEQHSKYNAVKYDINRTKVLNDNGYKVLRIWTNEIRQNIAGVVESIIAILNDIENIDNYSSHP